MKFFEMKVSGVAVDPSSFVPMIILKDFGEKNTLPIWVGVMEAAAVLSELENFEIERPMTHDLMKNIIENMDAEVQKVTITDLVDNIFYAAIYIHTAAGAMLEIDARPSDAIALAMRCRVPILASENVIFKARVIDLRTEAFKERSPEELAHILESLSAEDFGKYKM